MAEKTVREQLVEALEELLTTNDLNLKGDCRWCGRRPFGLLCGGESCRGRLARLALDRHRAEPECADTIPAEDAAEYVEPPHRWG